MKSKRTCGFTLVELLVVVVIIGILAAIALPNFIGARKKAQIGAVKSNMHTCQLAAESYAIDTGGAYSGGPASLIFFYAGGGNARMSTMGTFPTNPISGIANQVPAQCTLPTTNAVLTARSQSTQATYGGVVGQTTYCGIQNPDNPGAFQGYAITGNDDRGIAVLSSHGHLVLSNF